MSTTAYAHIRDIRARIFITLYTAVLVYLDDVFEHDVQAVHDFNQRFLRNEPQEDLVLDAFSKMLSVELPAIYGTFASNIIITSTLNLVTALLLEHETRGMEVCICLSNRQPSSFFPCL